MLNSLLGPVKTKISDLISNIKVSLFGANNERLDFVMDSFYKLSPTQRNIVVLSSIISVIFIFISILFLYFSTINRLDNKLSQNYTFLTDMKYLLKKQKESDAKFKKLISDIKSNTSSIRTKSYFEKLAKRNSIEIQNLDEKRLPFPPGNIMSKHFEEISVELRISKISIPRLLKFISDIDKSKELFRLKDLQIRSIYGNKLYFDAFLKIRGFKPL